MSFNSEDSPPISHLYLPTTFSQSLSSYFQENGDAKEGFLVGDWEVKRGTPGAGRTPKWSVGQGGSASLGVVTRRQSRGRIPDSSGEATEKGSSLRGMVLVVNVVGITRADGKQTEENVRVVGIVRRGGFLEESDGVTAADDETCCPLQVNLGWRDGGSFFIAGVRWRGSSVSDCASRLILFYYDPEELQRWKLPTEYPLGIPKVVFEGLSSSIVQNRDVWPVFPRVPLDHQDLEACSKVPVFSNSVINFVATRSSGLQQIIHKLFILTGTVLRTYPVLPVLNFLFLMAIDSLIGYLVTRYLLQFPNMMGLLHTTVDQMLAKLNHLLKWLRGAPAGLKLNPNLNSLYWRFFSYHIHLWANYIGILEPVFAVILYTIQYFGILGATIQVSLLKDLLSLATFHVYCLYIYATRLYSLQTSAIKALCRVFFGRKYNPLRHRIDSVQLTTPELFLSSFGFVILIFLFPTTMVYYMGFVFLRVPVLLLERLLQYLVVAYNKLPVMSWLLVYLKSPRVADEIYVLPVTPLSSPDYPTGDHHLQKCNYLAFRIHLQSTRKLFVAPNIGGGIKSIVSGVMDGTVLKD